MEIPGAARATSTFMIPLLNFHPLYQERVWGGRKLGDFPGRKLPGTTPIGESWELVDRPEAQSVVREGPWAGQTLRQVLEAHAAEVMGPNWPAKRPFPILVKWLDCRERLSLQVHPPASVAAQLGGEPKTENWYIAQAEAGAAVLAGLLDGVDAERFRAALAAGTAESLVQRMPTRAGDSLLIRSGVTHAIDAGNLILEIQQNSDTTYRVYDWGRVGLDGKPRAMHVEQSLVCVAANRAGKPALVRAAGHGAQVIAECEEFRVTRHGLAAGGTLATPVGEPRIVSVVEGELHSTEGTKLPRGENALVPYGTAQCFRTPAGAVVLVTDGFACV
jgi:mannose-6-phosphate isomerase